MLRFVGIADVQRDIRLPYRKDAGFVQHLGAHVAQLPQLAVGDALDGPGVLHDARIRHQDPGNIGPVFVHIGRKRRRCQSAGHIAAAAGQHPDMAIRHHAVKARNDDPALPGDTAQHFVGMLPVDLTVKGKLQPVGGIQKVIAQILRHQTGREIFPAGNQLILADPLLHFPVKDVKLPLYLH